MKKREYERAEIDFITLHHCDVIATSGGDGDSTDETSPELNGTLEPGGWT